MYTIRKESEERGGMKLVKKEGCRKRGRQAVKEKDKEGYGSVHNGGPKVLVLCS